MNPKHLILPLALLALLSGSCSKQDEQKSGKEDFEQHSTWTSGSGTFWNKNNSNGFQIDTSWGGDTTINF